jgi:anti-sigma factor RsiW
MTCEETQKSFSPYLDDALGDEACASLSAHLGACPFCRQRLAETRAVVRGLAALPRPATPVGLTRAISDALSIERAARVAQPHLPLWLIVARWIEPRVMPYTVGALTSALLFFTLANALRPHMRLLRDLAQAVAEPSESAVPAPPGSDALSLNPSGDLLRVMSDASREGGDDDITIVANVFSNGSASLEEVMQAPRDRRMLAQVEDALRRTPAFVPASLDRRPQTVRVVLSLSKVNVRQRSF